MQQQVVRYIEKERLFAGSDVVLVALSGGADSVALLHVLMAAGYRCEAAHCNFHLRGDESDRDERFVRQLCEKWGVRLNMVDFDTAQHAAERRVSIEMAARELRYEWFEQTREARKAKVVAVAHHRDDSVETMLLNLIRGTGIAGLLGIRPRNGNVVRPLLCVDRKEITDYLHSIGQDYVTDSTNLEDEYTRNKIRLKLLPMLQEINPSIKESLLETSNHLTEVATIYNKVVDEARQRVSCPEGIRISALLLESAPNAVLFEILHPLGFRSAQINDIARSLCGQSGKQFVGSEQPNDSGQANRWRAVKDRDLLLLKPVEQEDDASPLLTKEEKPYTSDFEIPREKDTACFDADKLNEPLYCRRWQTGDTFVPFGMNGKKKVSDYLTDRKFSLVDKERQWVLCCGERIAWLIGERIDNRFRVDEHTKRIIIFKVKKKKT